MTSNVVITSACSPVSSKVNLCVEVWASVQLLILLASAVLLHLTVVPALFWAGAQDVLQCSLTEPLCPR